MKTTSDKSCGCFVCFGQFSVNKLLVMKKYFVLLAVIVIDLVFSSVYAKSCVVFFSLDNIELGTVDASTAATRPDFNTHTVAQYIAQKTQSDFFRIETLESYPNKMNEAISVFQEQLSGEEQPKIKTDQYNLSSYDLIYLGYPVWLNDMPSEVVTYLNVHKKELEGKTVKIFSTTGGSPNTQSVVKLKQNFQKIVFGNSVYIQILHKDNYQKLVDEWLLK